MPSRFFVTGTDTGVGKTVVSALLCAALDATYWKPIQTGSREGTDRKTVLRLTKLPPYRTMAEAYCFAPPVSPHLAAKGARISIDVRKIRALMHSIPGNLVVEGAGGVLVPVNETQLMTDVMEQLGLPMLLVARSSLGTINHTLLSLAALRARALEIVGVVMVGRPNMENRKAIENYGRVEVVGTLPILRRINRGVLLEIYRKHFEQRAFTR
jgi:dethiobiotin synthetase